MDVGNQLTMKNPSISSRMLLKTGTHHLNLTKNTNSIEDSMNYFCSFFFSFFNFAR